MPSRNWRLRLQDILQSIVFLKILTRHFIEVEYHLSEVASSLAEEK